MSRFIQNKELLMSYLKTHPYMADAKTSVSPESVKGDHCSVVLYRQVRTWCFATASERDEFVRQHKKVAVVRSAL